MPHAIPTDAVGSPQGRGATSETTTRSASVGESLTALPGNARKEPFRGKQVNHLLSVHRSGFLRAPTFAQSPWGGGGGGAVVRAASVLAGASADCVSFPLADLWTIVHGYICPCQPQQVAAF